MADYAASQQVIAESIYASRTSTVKKAKIFSKQNYVLTIVCRSQLIAHRDL